VEVIVIHPVSGDYIELPKNSVCPRLQDKMCISGNECYRVSGITHDLLSGVTWVYLNE
jgi:hypothetical protein